MSDDTTNELLDGTIGERSLGHEPPIKVKIIDDQQKHHDIDVSSNITWVDIFKITMDAVQKKRSDFHYYDLHDEKKGIITAERWIEIASSRSLRKSQSYTVYLTPRPSHADPSMYYYVKVPELTEEEFLSRQDIPSGALQEDDLSIAKESPTHRNVGAITADITVKDNKLPNSVSTVDHASENAHQEMEGVGKNNTDSEITLPAMVQHDVAMKQAQSLGILSPGKELMEQLVTVSRQILWSFLLKTGSSTVHPLLKRFWGCVDTIRRKTAKDRMLDLLDHTKRDVFLSDNKSSDIERAPEPQAVGAEFLALALICKSHNLPFEAKTSNPHHKDNTLKLYKDYASELHYQANQRPQKRVFLDIRDLEEELDALDTLLGHQKECLYKFARSISPDTLRLTTMTRVAQNRVEKAYQDNHTRQLDMRIQEVQNMKTRLRFLKEQ
ncbi:hypothetical protein V8C34DRAFT_320505 [Trichoderma compactum]